MGRIGKVRPSLETLAAYWPTASVTSGAQTKSGRGIGGQTGGTTLRGAAELLWATPRTITGGAEAAERKQELGRTESGGGDLQAQAALWATPTSHPRTHAPRQVDHGEQLANQVSQWQSPQARDWKDGSPRDFPETLMGTPPLGRQVLKSGIGGPPSSPAGPSSPRLWTTPTQGNANGQNKARLGGASLSTDATLNNPKCRLNPLFVCWLMGLPLYWVDLAPLASISYDRWATRWCLPAPPTPS